MKKGNNRGFAATSILYTILVLFIMLIMGLLTMLYTRNALLTKIQQEVKDELSFEMTLYREPILNGADPVIRGELVPVIIADDGTVTKAALTQPWYKYESQKWANAVILTKEARENNIYTAGDIIEESAIESYFVWIPKYKYRLWDLGNYTDISGTSKPTTSNAGEIQIIFGTDTTRDAKAGECTTPMGSGETGNCRVGDYMTHPAFLSMNTNGLWVGKFETTGSISAITVKPNNTSLRDQTVSAMFNSAYNYKRDLDSHMMKNTEWGAAAYLSHSKYGINKEININNNSSHFTGYSQVKKATCFAGSTSSDCNEYGTIQSITQPYSTNVGYKSSTTGNITGIYDMSGGAREYMASYRDVSSGTIGNSGFAKDTIEGYDLKYFDVYNSNSDTTRYNYRILGDATGEMGPFYSYPESNGTNYYHNSWYGDWAYFIESSNPWFSVGAYYATGTLSGQFCFDSQSGSGDPNTSFRLVLV